MSLFVCLKVRSSRSAGYFYGEESFSTTLPKQKSHLDWTSSRASEQTSSVLWSNIVFYYQINWEIRWRPKHLTSLSSRPGIPFRDPNTSKLHPFIYQYSWQGGELYRQRRGKSQNFASSSHSRRVKCTATKVFWAEIKLRIFFIGSNREWPKLWWWGRCWPMRGFCRRIWPMRGLHISDHCPAQWSMECFISFCSIRTEKIKVLCFCCGPENW